MHGAAEAAFGEIAARFNAEQSAVHVALENKGDAETAVAGGLAAFAAKNAPDLLLVPDDLTPRMLSAKGTVKPLAEVLQLVNSPDFKFFIPATVTFMKDAKGQLYGFPLLASVPVFFYNKNAYVKAGLDPEMPPRTWHDLQVQLLKLMRPETEIACGYTTSDLTWVHIENLAAIHGQSIATKNNGLDGPGAQLVFNDLLHVRHTALMESWIKSELFSYSGHQKEGDLRFASGECATLTSASSALGDLLKSAKFEIGVAPVPFYEEGAASPFNALVGGSSLWVLGGKKPAEYKAIAQFLAFLSTPVIAAQWHQKTGTLPLTDAARIASEKSALYERISGFGAVMRQMTANTIPSPASRGIRLPQYEKVRDVINAELEEVWADRKPPKKGLDDAVRIGNALIRGTPLVETKAAARRPTVFKLAAPKKKSALRAHP